MVEALRQRALLWLLPALAGCGNSDLPVYHELAGSALGTTYSVKLVEPPATADKELLRQEIGDLLIDVNDSMSTYLVDSELSLLNANRSTDWIHVSESLCGAIEEALSISAQTDGAFDITVGPLVNLWGFGPGEPVAEPPPESRVRDLMEVTGHDHLHTDCTIPAIRKARADVYVDLSAYAKGLAVDRIAELLDSQGVSNYLVEIGGELRVRGKNVQGRDWAIAIETPQFAGRSVQTVIGLTDTAMATSGDYRNYFEYGGRLYSHTIDPRSGYPVDHNTASVTVIADRAAYADAMATALLVMGSESGLRLADELDVAAYFLLRVGEEFEERSSPTFTMKVALR